MTAFQYIGIGLCFVMVGMFIFFILGTVALGREVSEDELAGALEGDLTDAVKGLNEERS